MSLPVIVIAPVAVFVAVETADHSASWLQRFAEVVAEWLPLTYALNAVNRSMGRDDLYPFVLPSAVIDKLAFVHEVIRSAAAPVSTGNGSHIATGNRTARL